MKKQALNEDQGLLFSESECDELQKILQNNYQERFEKSQRIPDQSEEPDFEEEIQLPERKGLMQSDIFDNSEITECQQKTEQMAADKLKAEIMAARKKIKPPYYEWPINDNELLLNYQYEFIVHDDQNAYAKLLELANLVTKRLISRWLRNRGKFLDVYWDEITKDEKAMEAMVYVLRRYSTRVGWYVSTNFIVALNEGVRHVTGYETKIGKAITYVEDVNVAICQNQKKSCT